MEVNPLLEAKNLKVHFPIRAGLLRRQIGAVKAVDGIDFSINEGEVVALVGESGSGKSTAARAVTRLIEPTGGEVTFRGEDLLQFDKKRLQQYRKQVQFVFQDPYTSLNPRKTIETAIGEALLYHKLVKDQDECLERVIEVMQQVGLRKEMLQRYPHELSGGQQQRVCIGRAIALKPRLIICDEAVSALDISVQAQILNLLHDLKEQMGLSYLFITHDLSVVKYFADRILVMTEGLIVERGSSQEIFASPKNSYTQKLLSAIPVIPKEYTQMPS